ncbi:hypothetical protein GCM10011344_41200 [Dokdonia pacifica]|uniref:Uncharacterized protein n=1 Tax=Dokdonia pacifica TaxID=1627892 RepID=A0A239AD83_9FLAO|nr:hypothetical protein [Dokdonia pacifica]GGG36065.1 hypothetical protein GCM10011344_41200 [Dokdonia pacifica]SNR93004.1 hypothetical protein SAMN06265376_104306 [Dokdonia pacifica]
MQDRIETQKGIYLDDDSFFGSKKKRKRRRARRKKRRTTRKARQKLFAKKVGNVYREIGGATAIGQAVDTLLNPVQTDTSNTPSDFEIGLPSNDGQTDIASESKGIPTAFFIIGGVLVVGVIGVIIYKKKTIKLKRYDYSHSNK